MPGVGFPLASAWDAYLRGRYAWNERQIASLMQALDYFKRAISIQPLRELTRGSRTRTPSWAPRGTIHRLLRLFPVGRQTAPYSPELEPDIIRDRTSTEAPHASGVDETLHTL